MKQEQETNEILNHLREKYLPNSIRSNSFNKSMNMTSFQKYNNNILFPAFSEKTSFNDAASHPSASDNTSKARNGRRSRRRPDAGSSSSPAWTGSEGSGNPRPWRCPPHCSGP